jgi:hypothetical protein
LTIEFWICDKKYKHLIKPILDSKEWSKQREKLEGEFFDYPDCCVEALPDRTQKIKRPKEMLFIYHTACSKECAESKRMNKEYRSALKKVPQLYTDFLKDMKGVIKSNPRKFY